MYLFRFALFFIISESAAGSARGRYTKFTTFGDCSFITELIVGDSDMTLFVIEFPYDPEDSSVQPVKFTYQLSPETPGDGPVALTDGGQAIKEYFQKIVPANYAACEGVSVTFAKGSGGSKFIHISFIGVGLEIHLEAGVLNGSYCAVHENKDSSKESYLIKIDPFEKTWLYSWARNRGDPSRADAYPYTFDAEDRPVFETEDSPFESIQYDPDDNSLLVQKGDAQILFAYRKCKNQLLGGTYRGIRGSTTTIQVNDESVDITTADRTFSLEYITVTPGGEFVFADAPQDLRLLFARQHDALSLKMDGESHVLIPPYLL